MKDWLFFFLGVITCSFETRQQRLYVKKKVFHSHLIISYIDSELFRSLFRLKIASAGLRKQLKKKLPPQQSIKKV